MEVEPGPHREQPHRLRVMARRGSHPKESIKMKSSILAAASAVALGLSAGIALSQEAGIGGDPNASKNQVPGPSVANPSDPSAGNPGSVDQVPTAPQKQEDLYDNGITGESSGDVGNDAILT